MLDFMRRQSHNLKWVWGILIFIMGAGMVIAFVPFGDLTNNATPTSDVASIGGEKVSAREFQTAYRNYLDRMRSQLSPEMLKAFRFDRQILDALISRHVMMEEANRLGLNVSSSEIEQKILENPVFREGGNFIGLDRYQSILQQNNMTVTEFESSVRDDILMEKLRSFIGAGVTVTDKEVEDEYRNKNEKVKLSYFVIDPTKLIPKVTVTDQEQRDYYEKNKAKYTVPEKRQAKYIYLETLKQRKNVTVTDDELRQYYNQHQTEYILPERVTAQHILFKTEGKTPAELEAIKTKAAGILSRAKKGEDFSALAKQYSEDSSAAAGGNLGTFTKGQMLPEFDTVAFSLAPGAISDLVQTKVGLHIIKVIDKQAGRQRPFEEVKAAIEPIVSTRKAEQLSNDTAQQIAVELTTNKDLKAVADKHGAEVRETPLIEQNGTIPELGNASEFVKKMFSMNKGDFGTSVQVERGFVIPQLTEIQAAHPASFEEAKDKLLPDVKAEKARTLAADQTKQITDMLKSGKDLAAAAKAVGAEIKTSDFIARGGFVEDYGSLGDLDKEVFTLPLGKPGTPTTVGGKTIAFVVKERQEIDPAAMKAGMEALRAEMLPAKRDEYFNAYIQEARKRMEAAKQITINDSVLDQMANQIG